MSDPSSPQLTHREGFARHFAFTYPHDESMARAERFEVQVRWLDSRGIDIESVFAVLDEAMFIQRREEIRRNQQQEVRETIAALEQVRTGARRALDGLQLYYKGWNEKSRNLRTLRKVIFQANSDLERIEDQGHSLRRPRRGRPQEHVSFVHTRLKALRVPKPDRTELLQVLGLVQEPKGNFTAYK